MLGVVFSVICILSFVYSLFAGTTAEVTSALLDGAGRAVEVTLSLIGVMSLWTGVMETLREAGAIRALSKLLRPLTKLLFPEAARTGKGIDSAVACISANLLGIGNAATPLGIAAISEMQDGDPVARDDTIMLTVLNTASFSIIPTTVLALRRAAGAVYLFELLPVVWLTSGIGTLCAIVSVKLLCAIYRGSKHSNSRLVKSDFERGKVSDA
ncbi:MAG: spore maturation protein A [Clostridiales bacterium]|nr:spore maturation protein A [Clostridiales bacterium]